MKDHTYKVVDDIEPSNPVLAETKLLHAILQRLIIDATGLVGVEDERRKHKRDAWAFIDSSSHEPYSYRWICEALDLDPEALRTTIENIRELEDLDRVVPAAGVSRASMIPHGKGGPKRLFLLAFRRRVK